LGGKVEFCAKRDDCNSGLAFGGHKTRKLEYLIPNALAQGCDTLVTIGGIQSNHTRQVAAAAAHQGMKCLTVQENWVNWREIPAGSRVLYAHLGGLPALNGYSFLFRNG
jgi:1-aminocyclopropane-1-carboxylate deaminase